MRRSRFLMVLLVAAIAAAGCAASDLKARKDNAWAYVPQALPDTYEANPAGYAHPFRGAAFVLYPIGMALDYALVRPFYMLGGLAPEWFGLSVQDGQDFQAHYPELAIPRNNPRRFEPSQ